jgi:hypothetical protein
VGQDSDADVGATAVYVVAVLHLASSYPQLRPINTCSLLLQVNNTLSLIDSRMGP